MKLLLVDDHVLVRSGIRRLMEELPGFEVVGEADNGEEAVEIVQRAAPDIVVADIGMPRMTGLELTAWLMRHLPSVRTVILSMHTSEEYVLEAFNAGARGYLLKRSAAAEMALALEAVAKGDVYLSPGISRHLVAAYLAGPESARGQPKITPRQREVLKLLAQGRSSREIAAVLQLSVRTVETHRADLMQRLGVHDAMALLREAARLGLVPLDSNDAAPPPKPPSP